VACDGPLTRAPCHPRCDRPRAYFLISEPEHVDTRRVEAVWNQRHELKNALVTHEQLLTYSHILNALIACCRTADRQATGLDQIGSFGDPLNPPTDSCLHCDRATPTRASRQNANDVYRKIHPSLVPRCQHFRLKINQMRGGIK
jgi:hypothetical protein